MNYTTILNADRNARMFLNFLSEHTKNYIITMRPYLLFVSGITGIAGLSLGSGLTMIPLLLLSFSFFLTYGFGQALTDCFQTDTDSISSPYRPLVQGKLSKKTVMITSLIGLSLAGGVIIYFNIINMFFAILATLGLATYTWFKRRWWGGPFYNAWIVGVVFIMGYLSSPVLDCSWNSLIFAGTLLGVFFGYANFVLTGYYKDISADAKTGYNTLLVVFGMKKSAYVSDLFALLQLTGFLTAVYYIYKISGTMSYIGLALGIAGLIFLIVGQIYLHLIKSENEAYKSISPVVHSYILLLASIASFAKPGWGVGLLVFYTGYIITLKLRPEKNQI
jgi:4-hydroxybenzoate polyprenyltransferase